MDAKQPVPEQPLPDLEKSFEDVSTSMKKFTKQSLRFLQFNADGLKSKVDELSKRLHTLDIDVALIQETKLAKSDRTPTIPGFKPIREDRKGMRGGGLIIYVRDSLVYEVVDKRSIKATEILTIRIRLGRNKWVTATNLYCPPVNSTGQEISLELSSIPKAASSIIFGDFNAHHPIWDEVQPEDERGTDVVEWANVNSLSILNNGSVTRHSRVTGGSSSPDLTICGTTWEEKCQWAVDEEEIGGSDHLPIVITVMTSASHQPILGRAPRWRNNGVNWKKFSEEVDRILTEEPPEESLKEKVIRFTSALISAAKIHVRKVKPCKRKNSWMSPKVRDKIKVRNTLRRSIKTKRKEWISACTDVTNAKREARQEQWKEVVSSAIGDIDERNMWRLIKSLSGTPDLNSPNEAMVINGKRITSTKKKAELFAQHYANVSKLKLSREERRLNLKLKRLLGAKNKDETPYKDFTLSELKKAIAKMRRKGAPGPDDIPPSFLKELGPRALSVLLSICNESLRLGVCPQAWMNAIIIPLLKAAKSPSELASYRPVSLTSCVAKILERLFADRLYSEAESKGWFASIQAGFRRGHSCADQILRITQAIEDGFQQRKMNRSVLVLLDYSKAFDTVWRERLLLSMASKGVHIQVIRWIYGFLQNRQARVRLHDQLSSSKKLHQGLPQGCVLSPLLFLFFINNLAELLVSSDPDMAAKLIFSLFADDVTILATHRSREEAAAAAQWAVNLIHGWSVSWKLNLNASKSEVSFFSTWTHEANWQPSLQIDGKPVPFNPTPKLLGVYLDRQLCFAKHTAEVSKSASAKVKIISAVANKKWGWRKEELKKLFFSYVRSKLDYAGPAWQPWLSASNISILESTQNKAMRAMTGQLKSTPVEALRFENQLPSYKSHIDRNCLKSFEQAKRLPPTHPRKLALTCAAHPTNNRDSWFRHGTKLSEQYIPPEAEARQPIRFYEYPPDMEFNSVSIKPDLEGSTGRHDDPDTIRAATIEAINKWDSDLTIFTDGSAVAGCKDGGSAAVIFIQDDGEQRSETVMRKGAPFTSSFEEECEAMHSAFTWIDENCDSRSRPIILTDSQSLCKSLLGYDPAVDTLRSKLASCTATVRIQWVPGHCGIPGNEAADAAANEARTIPGPRRPTSYRSIASTIKQAITDPPCREEQTHISDIYSKLSSSREAAIKSRWDQVYLARLRSGHHWDLRHYQNRVNPELDPKCRRCNFPEETIQHMFQCPGTIALRQLNFGFVEVPLSALTEFPEKSLALARGFLRGVGEASH